MQISIRWEKEEQSPSHFEVEGKKLHILKRDDYIGRLVIKYSAVFTYQTVKEKLS